MRRVFAFVLSPAALLTGLADFPAGAQIVIPDPIGIHPTDPNLPNLPTIDLGGPGAGGPPLNPYVVFHYGGPHDLGAADAARNFLTSSALLDQEAEAAEGIAYRPDNQIVEDRGVAGLPDAERLTSLHLLLIDRP